MGSGGGGGPEKGALDPHPASAIVARPNKIKMARFIENPSCLGLGCETIVLPHPWTGTRTIRGISTGIPHMTAPFDARMPVALVAERGLAM
jgi:hypothetical protein